MTQELWRALVNKALRSAHAAGERRYVIAQHWEVCGAHGWTYHVVNAHEHMRVRPERYR